MSPSKREDLAARLSAPSFQPPERPAPATRPTARTKPIRRTLDLAVARHHALNTWCDEESVQLGVPRVPGQYVLDELVGLLLTDVRTQQMIREALRKRFEGK
jgi:hypothetical protein